MPALPVQSKDDCLSYALSQSTAFVAAGSAIGFLKAHFGYKELTLKQKMNRWANFVHTGKVAAGPIVFLTGMGLTFAATECAVYKLRNKDDVYNSVIAGLATGALVGGRKGSAAAVMGHSLLFAGGAVAAQFFATTTHDVFDGVKGYGPVEKSGSTA